MPTLDKKSAKRKRIVEDARRNGQFWLAREVDPKKLDGYTVVFHLETHTKVLKEVEVTTKEIPSVCLPKNDKICKEEAFTLFHKVEEALVDCVCKGTRVKTVADLTKAAKVIADSWKEHFPDRALAQKDPSKVEVEDSEVEKPCIAMPILSHDPQKGAGHDSLEFSWFLPGRPGEEPAISGWELALYCFDFTNAEGVAKTQLGETVMVSNYKRSYKFGGLRPSRQHWCQIRAVGEDGAGKWSPQSGKTKSHAVKPIPTRQQKQARIQASIAEAKAMQKAREFAKQQMIARGLTHDKDAIKAPDLSRSDGDHSPSRSPSHSPPGHSSAAATTDKNGQEGPLQLLNVKQSSNSHEPNEALAAITRARRVAAGILPRHPGSGPSKGQRRPRQLVATEGNQWGLLPRGKVPFDDRRLDAEKELLKSKFWQTPTSPRRHSTPGRAESPRRC